jgi:DNA mismatch repair protein MutL
MIADNRHLTKDKSAVHEQIALSLARATAMPYGKTLSREEINQLIDQLFACQNHNYSPSGNRVIIILSEEEILGRF